MIEEKDRANGGPFSTVSIKCENNDGHHRGNTNEQYQSFTVGCGNFRRFEAKRLFSALPSPDDEDARRARKATANRILTMLKAALSRAFHADRVSSDAAWRKVKPFKRVDEAVVRYLTTAEARRLVNACREDFRKLVLAALLTGCRYAEPHPSQVC